LRDGEEVEIEQKRKAEIKQLEDLYMPITSRRRFKKVKRGD
jgi:hypothetical protein